MKGFKTLTEEVSNGFFINSEVTHFIINDGFRPEPHDDSYSENSWPILFHKRLSLNTDDFFTVTISKTAVAIEHEYSSGSGCSAGLWKFEIEDINSFREAYNDMVEKVKELTLSYGIRKS